MRLGFVCLSSTALSAGSTVMEGNGCSWAERGSCGGTKFAVSVFHSAAGSTLVWGDGSNGRINGGPGGIVLSGEVEVERGRGGTQDLETGVPLRLAFVCCPRQGWQHRQM